MLGRRPIYRGNRERREIGVLKRADKILQHSREAGHNTPFPGVLNLSDPPLPTPRPHSASHRIHRNRACFTTDCIQVQGDRNQYARTLRACRSRYRVEELLA